MGRAVVRPERAPASSGPARWYSRFPMSRHDHQERAEDAEQREADDALVQLERTLRDGKSVDVQDVRKAWRSTRYPRAMVQVLAQRRRTDLAVRAAGILGI